MKKNKNLFIKKYDNIFVLVFISLISIALPSSIYAACNSGKCKNTFIGANSDADAKTGDGGGNCAGFKYCFPNTDEKLNIQTFDIFYDSKGNPLRYVLHGDYNERDKNALKAMGVPDNMIVSSDDLGLKLPAGSIDNENLANEWKAYYQDLKKDFAYVDENGDYSINPESDYYKLGVALGLYTGDVKQDTKNLVEGNTTAFSVEKATILSEYGNNKLLTASNADSVCAERINDYSSVNKTGPYCRAIRDSKGQFDDIGDYECTVNKPNCVSIMKLLGADSSTAAATCCLMKYGADQTNGACCNYFHSADECNNSNPPDNPEPTECPAPNIVTPHYVNPPTRNTSYTTGGTCGGNYTSVSYDYTQTMCEGLVVIEKQTTISVSLSGLNQELYYAGSTFNWSGISSYKNEMTNVFDTSALQNKISEIQAKIKNFESQISNIECQISRVDETISDSSCTNLTGEAHENCLASISRARAQKKEELTEAINKIKENPEYINAYQDLEKYNNCSDDASNYIPTYNSSTNLISVNKEQISFKNTNRVYQKREVVAINKNNGEPLTLNDMNDEILEKGAYLEVNSDYYVPISIKNGTNGIAHRELTGENVSISYDCPFDVSNYIRCAGDECGSKGINIIYRPISLTNPFPSNDSQHKYRELGVNWSDELAEKFILNNRGVGDYDVYNLKPMYTIMLTPSTIKNIRNYNKSHSMNDFNLTCTGGYDCISKFLWEEFDGIVDTSKSCATSNGLDQTCYSGGVS